MRIRATLAGMESFYDRLETLDPGSGAEWRSWLSEHHRVAEGIWLVLRKVKSKRAGVRYEDAVRMALCFGWIDSKTRSLDDDSFLQTFTPRKPGSTWSASNKRRVAELLASGEMEAAGLSVIEQAKRDGSWAALDNAEKLGIPEDLQMALDANPAARRNFDEFSDSRKMRLVYWIADAKRTETRRNRIDRTIEAAARGELPVG